ncbi:MAG TPA: hypothetical protein VF403_26735 [Kofleriaceae bacterium]|jgi:uncharacterized membrane protein HdeD (DUF308 family)
MRFFCAAFAISIVSGLFTAAWGAYKDAPLERFNAASFWRSVVFSACIFGIFIAAEPLRGRFAALHLVQVFLLVMGIERLAIEIYKPCFRREDQTKYLIPQDMSFLGLNVASRATRIWVGLALISGTLGVLLLATPIATFASQLVVATLVGLFICCGGAAKDAPFEGFQPRKFLRSALVLAAASPLLHRLGPVPLGLYAFMCGGLERLIVESYKTYFTQARPGKFRRDLPVIDPRFLRHRPRLRALAASIVMLVSALYTYVVVS